MKAKKRLYPFREARKIARNYGFTKEEFIEYECAGAYQLPKNPDHVWSDEWKGWDDFLGTPLTFEQGRQVARTLENASTQEEYMELIQIKACDDDDIKSRLPYRPDLKYKNDGWIDWSDWLGK
eukprot:CAMPEP_0198279938 /NCGR_PEP_ID=MMETSP1449-20131203/131_1 /TAXON_ID=420275 /ORGANISM="Attheya septentrionalis, Strain CCMP2084" /LENGTH=122 /DNA_ID=CAMNT_0043975189 /DNA_START=186 /DNA_END=554 /DNA_ORIENTATION=-